MANSSADYLSASQQYSAAEVAKGNAAFAQASVTPGKLGTEVAQVAGSTNQLTQKQQETTDGGCGTAFTTATEPAKINVQQSLGGHVSKVETVNQNGDTQIKIITSDGKSLTMAEDGSVIVTTAKQDGNAKSGRFDVRSQGSTRFLIGESLAIEVENKNHVNSGKDGDSNTAIAFSLKVYGNVAIECVGGELNAKAKNISLNAENEITLKAGSKVGILSGAGKGQNTPSTTSSGATKAAAVEYGGLVEIKGGDLFLDSQTIRQKSAVDYKIVSHDGAILSTEKLSNYGLRAPGSFTVEVGGDLYENISGLKRTNIGGSYNPATSLFPSNQHAYFIDVQSTPQGFNAVSIQASKSGGFAFSTKQGDIDISTSDGYWGIANPKSVVAGIDKVKKEYPNAKTGTYLQSNGELTTTVRSTKKVEVYAGTLESSGISLSPESLLLKNPKGIYLN
jgi:hypothetical protein